MIRKRLLVGVAALAAIAAGTVGTFHSAAAAAAGPVYTQIIFDPQPIADPGMLGAEASLPVVIVLKDAAGNPVTLAEVFLSFTGPGVATVTVGTTPTALTATPALFIAEDPGFIIVHYTSASTLPVVGSDVITAQSLTTPNIKATDSYSYGSVTGYTWSVGPPIAPNGTLVGGQSVTFTVAAETANGTPAPGATVELSMTTTASAPGGATGIDGKTSTPSPITSEPKGFDADANGKVSITYTAPASLPTGGVDTLTALDPDAPAVTAVTTYTFGALPTTSPLYTVDGFGGVHPVGSAPAVTTTAYWPGWDIARGIVTRTDHSGGYVLDGFGGIHPFGSATAFAATGYWPNWDIARGIALTPDNLGGWVLDAFGGVHAFGTAPAATPTGYWPGWDIARGIAADPSGKGGWVLDGFGGLHPFGDADPLPFSGYWPNWDIARGIAVTPSGKGGYVLDGFGGLHQFGDAAPVTGGAYWPNWTIARGIVLSGVSSSTNPGGWVVDGFGGIHQFGSAPAEAPTGYWPNWAIVRGIG